MIKNNNKVQDQLVDYRMSSKVNFPPSKNLAHISNRGPRISGSVALNHGRDISRKLSTGGKNDMLLKPTDKNVKDAKKGGGGLKILNFFQKLARLNINQKGA